MYEATATLNPIRALWAEGRCVLGVIATIPSVQMVQIIACSGLDFIIIDMEHGPIGPAEAHAATIEHVDVLQKIKEVVAVPGLDLAFIGPGDLATSMGHRGRAEHPEVQEVAMRLEEAIRSSPVVLGGVAPTSDQANAMIERGYRALVIGFDWSLLQRGVASALDGITSDRP